ncbi:MAG: hypothetical protein LBG93_07400 [Treponema sp.]|jgi:hypothetical protein|nr:hypothetical protein [Treponema sp.]
MKAKKENTGKPAVKPVAKPAAAPAKKDMVLERLSKELRSLIPKLDAEGLIFLVKQAKVHIYNMQVDELNNAAAAAKAATPAAGAAKASSAKSAAGQTKNKALRIKGSESGSSYYLYYANSHVMFSKNEIIELVKIASGSGTELEICRRLFVWFGRERKDVFSVLPIQDMHSESLKELIEKLKKNFKVR